MKLVEILARSMKRWPWGAPIKVTGQNSQGKLYLCYLDGDEYGITGKSFRMAEDKNSEVTRDQWEAERARIAAEDAPTWQIGTETEEWREECQKQYEQELWDKVALKTLAAQIQNPQSIGADVGWCADVADAFMAERAKRMKQGANHE